MWIHLMKNKKIFGTSLAPDHYRHQTPDQPLARSITTAGRGILTQIKSSVLSWFASSNK
jgi:hypothetical protein